MALFGDTLLVLNTYSDSISVIDTATNMFERTIDLGLPIAVPGQDSPAYGAGPNAIAVDHSKGIAYVALYNANAIAVVDLSGGAKQPVMGLIPVGYAPASVVLDTADKVLLVANDKGIGTRFSFETDYGVTGYNTHQDNGTVSIVPLPDKKTLASMTTQVYQYNHWDLTCWEDQDSPSPRAHRLTVAAMQSRFPHRVDCAASRHIVSAAAFAPTTGAPAEDGRFRVGPYLDLSSACPKPTFA
jgi:YVTN family beta-propeller protein